MALSSERNTGGNGYATTTAGKRPWPRRRSLQRNDCAPAAFRHKGGDLVSRRIECWPRRTIQEGYGDANPGLARTIQYRRLPFPHCPTSELYEATGNSDRFGIGTAARSATLLVADYPARRPGR